MLKRLAIGLGVALVGMMLVAGPGSAQPPGWGPPPPPGWGPPPPPPWGGPHPPPPHWGGPGFGIYIGPPVYRRAPMYCNYGACAATYRSFRGWDCSYQPLYGPRRRCMIP